MIGGAKGIGIGIDFGIPNQYCRATSKPYIEKDVLDSLRVVASAYGKTNEDSDRSIVKNLVDPDNPFVISNAAFKLNSGFGKYSADFESFDWAVNISQKQHNKATISLNGRLCNHAAIEVDEMKVNIIGNVTELIYWYIANPDDTTRSEIRLTSGINTLPKSYAKDDGQTYNIGFAYISGDSEITIEQIPSFEGAFVTDGIDDLITSTKTVQEMLGGSTEFTAVSMIHLISPGQDVDGAAYTNYIRTSDNYWTSNRVSNTDKTGIYGYSFKQGTPTVIDNILGDKNDYTAEKADDVSEMFRAKFSIEGFEHVTNGAVHVSSVAWYWTIIANKVLTTDQINQVIAYFNLDRTLKPDILCGVKKQGITNENHAEFGDKLIDFSDNGRDIQLNNIGWKGDSGIGKYEVDFLDWVINSPFINERTSFTFSSSNDTNNDIITIYQRVPAATQSFKIKAKLRGRVLYRYYVNNGDTISISYYEVKEGINILPDSADPTSVNGKVGFVLKGLSSVKVEQVPFHAGALCLDGVNDFGKVTGMPVYKDYTVVTDREIFANIGAISSKNNPGAFVETAGNSVYSFGQATSGLNFISTRSISYLSKYSYCGQSITAGAAEDGTDMWLGTIRDNDTRFFNGAIYSLMSFPYSMSEFLIERQLKKHKLGTLYPNMVEWRPIIKSNVSLATKLSFAIRGTSTLLNAGDYIPENSEIWVVITMNNAADRITKFVINGNTIDIPSSAYNPSTMKYGFPFTIDSKSPQKITMTIEQDENYVQWNPVVTSNVEYTRLDFYLNNYVQLIKIGDYIPKDAYLRANLYLKNNVDELTVFTFNGVNINYKRSVVDDTAFNIGAIYNYDSSQKVNITIDEYIRYEDIKQPYPVIFQIKDRNTSKIYNWGDKIKVGSSIQLSQGENPNLLNGLYSIQSYEYEGKTYSYNQLTNLNITLTKQSISLSCNKTWLLDNNEPKCILSCYWYKQTVTPSSIGLIEKPTTALLIKASVGRNDLGSS